MTNKAIKSTVKGRVQGVGYRASVHKKATSLGLKGYIRGLAGNKLEVIAEGEEESLIELCDFLKVGPNGAEVEKFDLEWIEPTDDYIRFAIKY